MFKFREQERVQIHRNKQLDKYYDTLSDTEKIIAIETVDFIKKTFPITRIELMGDKVFDFTSDIT